jgi:mono/diheme cytochrome c family protein
MRHVAVKRVAILLAAVFLLWAGVFAWIVRREPASGPAAPAAPTLATGAALFERHCASCHTVEEMRAAVVAEPGGTRRPELERFLEGHGDGSAEEDRQILDYLGESGQVEK